MYPTKKSQRDYASLERIIPAVLLFALVFLTVPALATTYKWYDGVPLTITSSSIYPDHQAHAKNAKWIGPGDAIEMFPRHDYPTSAYVWNGKVPSYQWVWNGNFGYAAIAKCKIYTYPTYFDEVGYYIYSDTVGYTGTSPAPAYAFYASDVKPAWLNETGANTSVVADFIGIPTSGTVPLTVTFTDLSTGAPINWSWSFGDGETSTEQNPPHVYDSAGTYSVGLTVANATGTSSLERIAYVNVTNLVPVADFTGTPVSGNAPLTVQFTDASSGEPTAWNWSFGDGVYSAVQNPSHTYANAGSYTVKLTVANADGGTTNTKTGYIVATLPIVTCSNALCADGSFENNPLGGPHLYAAAGGHWGSNNDVLNNETNQPPVHPIPPIFGHNIVKGQTLQLWQRLDLTDANTIGIWVNSSSAGQGKTLNVQFFTGSDSIYDATYVTTIAMCPLPTEWTRCTVTIPDSARTANTFVKIQGTSFYGITAVDNFEIDGSCYSSPLANFIATPLSGPAPLTVNFTDTSNGDPTSWQWYFGDDSYSPEQNPTHTYMTAGSYTVSHAATNAAGTTWLNRTAYVNVTGLAPVANFTATPTSGNAPLTVQFTDASTGEPTSWNWSFGDGDVSVEQNPSHVYAAAGTYTVALNVSNAGGNNTMVKTGYVVVTNQGPIADFTGTPLSGNSPLQVQFTDVSTISPISWSWDFGDGVFSTDQNPLHMYWNPGTYTVNLTAVNASGSNMTVKRNFVTVNTAAYQASNYDFDEDGIHTANVASIAGQYQTAQGYNSVHSLTNSNAADAFDRMETDNIFYFAGHGFMGQINFGDRMGEDGIIPGVICADCTQYSRKISDFNNNPTFRRFPERNNNFEKLDP